MTCRGCRHLYHERHLRIFLVDLCRLSGEVVGFDSPLGCIETEGCRAYERPPAWPVGAIA